jgi:tRNA(fMet)-specific endonuclease VapC
MGVIFDSSEIIALERNRSGVASLIGGREDEPFGISAVTVAELLNGVERADTEARRLKRQAFVEKVIELFPVFPRSGSPGPWNGRQRTHYIKQKSKVVH